MRHTSLFLLSLLLIACEESDSVLSDEELLDYANSPFEPTEVMNTEIILGSHNGTPIKVSFPCSDLCPQNTVRIISYEVDLAECEAVGGEIRSILVPIAITVMPQDFCVPAILPDN